MNLQADVCITDASSEVDSLGDGRFLIPQYEEVAQIACVAGRVYSVRRYGVNLTCAPISQVVHAVIVWQCRPTSNFTNNKPLALIPIAKVAIFK